VFIRYVFSVFALLGCLTGAAYAQPAPATPTIRFTIVPLTVEKGFPLQVILTDKLHFKLHERVHGKIVEPVYAFDREVIPPGTDVVGTITGFRQRGKWKRVSSILGGDFTPVRDPQISFDALVLEDGTRIPIETSVEPGTDALVRFNGEAKRNTASLKPHLPETGQMQAITDAGKQSGNLLKGMLWGLAPYHPQSVPAGLRYQATLLKPLELGSAILGIGALDRIGSEPPTGSMIYARLETPLNSRTTKSGATVKALLTNPLFSWDHLLIFPVGSRLVGEVVEVRPAGRLNRTGGLAFKFTKIEPPVSILAAKWPIQDVEGRLVGVQLGNEMNHVRIDQDGATSIAQSKERFVAPAFALFNMSRGFNTSSQSFSHALTGGYTASLISRLLVGDSGLGLPAGIAGRMIPPVGIGLGLYSAARSVFINILARGQEINFPVNTPIEIRVDAARPADGPASP
jgi:hypothetical protein